ncbi:MAG TPA: nitroreductase [Candidatus Acidoferrum sp.]|nr:nitroreductase [Candidatus Acidoferrum sp.]
MNEVLKAITERRSIRQYRPDEVPPELLETVLAAGRAAPSGMNAQGWHFLVFEGAALAALRDVAGGELGYGAPALVVVSYGADPRAFNPGSDCANAIMCMMLAAHSLGLGSCWINNLTRRREIPEIDAFLRGVGLPLGQTVHGSLALGYPDEAPAAKPRAENTVTYAVLPQ